MAVLNILIAPHPSLSTKVQAVLTINDEVKRELQDMVETMYADSGIGLAANQVNILKRMFVMDVGEDNSLTQDNQNPIESKLYYFINPLIESASTETSVFEEGCLSAPGHRVKVERPVAITVRYTDINGSEIIQDFDGLQARCIQHEIDHLDGKTMLEYLSKLKKDMVIKRLVKRYTTLQK